MFIKWFFFVDLADINVTCDILIIGAGSSGAQCAHFLCDQGLSVVVVDKRKVGEGSTSTNTALIQYTGEESFISLKNTFGEEAAARQLKLCEQSINHIEPFSKSEGVRIYGVLAKIVTHKIMHGSSPDSDLYLQNRPLVEKKHSNSFHVHGNGRLGKIMYAHCSISDFCLWFTITLKADSTSTSGIGF